jgi:hypothetical protein
MATLAQQRQAIAAGMAASRAPTGEAERKAIGKSIEAERRGESMVEDINRLVTPTKPRRTLRTAPLVGAVPAGQGRANYTPPAATGGGIASPLTETTKDVGGKTVPDEVLWPAGYPSSDGLFVLPAWRTKNFTDANGDPVVIEYADPAGVAV